jgi:hypothetical protein
MGEKHRFSDFRDRSAPLKVAVARRAANGREGPDCRQYQHDDVIHRRTVRSRVRPVPVTIGRRRGLPLR